MHPGATSTRGRQPGVAAPSLRSPACGRAADKVRCVAAYEQARSCDGRTSCRRRAPQLLICEQIVPEGPRRRLHEVAGRGRGADARGAPARARRRKATRYRRARVRGRRAAGRAIWATLPFAVDSGDHTFRFESASRADDGGACVAARGRAGTGDRGRSSRRPLPALRGPPRKAPSRARSSHPDARDVLGAIGIVGSPSAAGSPSRDTCGECTCVDLCPSLLAGQVNSDRHALRRGLGQRRHRGRCARRRRSLCGDRGRERSRRRRRRTFPTWRRPSVAPSWAWPFLRFRPSSHVMSHDMTSVRGAAVPMRAHAARRNPVRGTPASRDGCPTGPDSKEGCNSASGGHLRPCEPCGGRCVRAGGAATGADVAAERSIGRLLGDRSRARRRWLDVARRGNRRRAGRGGRCRRRLRVRSTRPHERQPREDTDDSRAEHHREHRDAAAARGRGLRQREHLRSSARDCGSVSVLPVLGSGAFGATGAARTMPDVDGAPRSARSVSARARSTSPATALDPDADLPAQSSSGSSVSSASAIASADAKRFSGSRSRPRITIASSSGGSDGRELARRRHDALEHARDNRRVVGAAEERLAREQLPEHDRCGVHVGPRGDGRRRAPARAPCSGTCP